MGLLRRRAGGTGPSSCGPSGLPRPAVPRPRAVDTVLGAKKRALTSRRVKLRRVHLPGQPIRFTLRGRSFTPSLSLRPRNNLESRSRCDFRQQAKLTRASSITEQHRCVVSAPKSNRSAKSAPELHQTETTAIMSEAKPEVATEVAAVVAPAADAPAPAAAAPAPAAAVRGARPLGADKIDCTLILRRVKVSKY